MDGFRLFVWFVVIFQPRVCIIVAYTEEVSIAVYFSREWVLLCSTRRLGTFLWCLLRTTLGRKVEIATGSIGIDYCYHDGCGGVNGREKKLTVVVVVVVFLFFFAVKQVFS